MRYCPGAVRVTAEIARSATARAQGSSSPDARPALEASSRLASSEPWLGCSRVVLVRAALLAIALGEALTAAHNQEPTRILIETENLYMQNLPATAQWIHYGVWRPASSEVSERPLSAILLSGWACARPGGWVIQVGTLELIALISSAQSEFLSQVCIQHGYQCWVTGLVVMTNRTKVMVPDEMSIYSVGSPGASLRPSPALGRRLAEDARSCSLAAAWEEVVLGTPGRVPPRPAHPLALLALHDQAADVGERPELAAGHIFATCMQAATETGTCMLYPCSRARLGSSDTLYDFRQQCCVSAAEPPSSLADAPFPVQGCFVVAGLPRTLLDVAVGASSSPGVEDVLLVCIREALPSMEAALSAASLAHSVALSRDALEQCCGEASHVPIVLVSAELCDAHYEAVCAARPWKRVILLLGWPARTVSRRLLRPRGAIAGAPTHRTCFPCILQIVLCLVGDLSTDSLSDPQVFPEVATLLGAPADALGDAAALRDLLAERVLRIRDEPDHKMVATRYNTEFLDAPSASELEDVPSFHLTSHDLSCLFFGHAATSGRRALALLPAGETLEEYFKRRGRRKGASAASTFVSASLQAPATEEARQCAICIGEAPASAVTACGHWFCPQCITKVLQKGFKQCPVCREPLPNCKDVVVPDARDVRTSFLEGLAEKLKSPPYADAKTVLVCSWSSTHERIARLLRCEGIHALSWSGNAQQLRRNMESFLQAPGGACLLTDPVCLSLRWISLPDVRHLLVLMPLSSDRGEPCCQIRDCLQAAPKAAVTMLRCRHLPYGPIDEMPTCHTSAYRTCPILLERSATVLADPPSFQ